MKSYKHILALDPSGNWREGKGTTGFCLLTVNSKHKEVHAISAMDYDRPEAYWDAHIKYIDSIRKNRKSLILVIEDYLLYASKASNQINSRMETPKLIGILQHYCYANNIPYCIEPASAVKTRWTNDILAYKKFIERKNNAWYMGATRLSKHHLDAVRHAVHYMTFLNGKEEKK